MTNVSRLRSSSCFHNPRQDGDTGLDGADGVSGDRSSGLRAYLDSQ